MNYKELFKDIKNNKIENLYFFYGQEQLLLERAVEAIKEKILQKNLEDMNYQKIDGNNIKVSDLLEFCETLPFMGEKRMIYVKSFNELEGKKKVLSDDEIKRMSKYFEHIPESTILIFTSQKVNKTKKLYKTLQKNGCVINFEKLEKSELEKKITQYFNRFETNIGAREVHCLVNTTGYFNKDSEYNLMDLENDMKKLIAYVNDSRTISCEDIETVITKNVENNIFQLIDFISKKDGKNALVVLNEIILNGEAAYKILFLLYRQFNNIYKIKLFSEMNRDIKKIAELTHINLYAAKKLNGLANQFKKEKLEQILNECADIDRGIKTGRMEGKLGLEVFISRISI